MIVGDGAIGLAAVPAVRRAGAVRVLVVGHHSDRLALARDLGADETVDASPDLGDAIEQIIGLTAGSSAVLECVGTQSSWTTAIAVARDGGRIGHIGTPHPVERLDVSRLFDRNVALAGGLAPARAYLPELIQAVVDGALDPRPLVDLVLPLEEIVDAYAALDARVATKVHLTF